MFYSYRFSQYLPHAHRNPNRYSYTMDLFAQAAQGWLDKRTIVCALLEPERFGLAFWDGGPQQPPVGGAVRLYDAAAVPKWRADGGAWSHPERHASLKIDGARELRVYYSRSLSAPGLLRRAFRLPELPARVLVQYLDAPAPKRPRDASDDNPTARASDGEGRAWKLLKQAASLQQQTETETETESEAECDARGKAAAAQSVSQDAQDSENEERNEEEAEEREQGEADAEWKRRVERLEASVRQVLEENAFLRREMGLHIELMKELMHVLPRAAAPTLPPSSR